MPFGKKTEKMEAIVHDFFKEMASKPIKERIFVSENDLVLNLAFYIKTRYPESLINFEFPFRIQYERQNTNNGKEQNNGWSYLDFLIIYNEVKYGFELKYLTSQLQLDFITEGFHLKNQGAQDILRFNFRKDVFRLEKLKERGEIDFSLAILLTNDHLLIHSDPSKLSLDTDYRFNSVIGIKGGEAFWRKTPGKESSWLNNKKYNLALTLKHHGYTFTWNNYLTLGEKRNEDFKYGVVVV
jgi:hypothetical protein